MNKYILGCFVLHHIIWKNAQFKAFLDWNAAIISTNYPKLFPAAKYELCNAISTPWWQLNFTFISLFNFAWERFLSVVERHWFTHLWMTNILIAVHCLTPTLCKGMRHLCSDAETVLQCERAWRICKWGHKANHQWSRVSGLAVMYKENDFLDHQLFHLLHEFLSGSIFFLLLHTCCFIFLSV